MGGGGGATGDVNYPESTVVLWQGAMQNIHDVIETGADGFVNPYTNQSFTENPKTIFGTCIVPCTILTTLLALDFSDIPSGSDIEDVPAVTIPPIEDIDDSKIDGVVDAHSAVMDLELEEAKGRLDQEALQGGAVLSSAYAIGKTLLEDAVLARSSEVDAKLRYQAMELQIAVDKNKMLGEQLKLQHSQLQIGVESARIQGGQAKGALDLERDRQGLALSSDIQRMVWASELEKFKTNLEVEVREIFFKTDKYLNFFKGYSSFTGGMPGEDGKKLTDTQAALGGALVGASAGAMAAQAGMMGSVGGPGGAAIGAGVGLAAGLLLT